MAITVSDTSLDFAIIFSSKVNIKEAGKCIADKESEQKPGHKRAEKNEESQCGFLHKESWVGRYGCYSFQSSFIVSVRFIPSGTFSVGAIARALPLVPGICM